VKVESGDWLARWSDTAATALADSLTRIRRTGTDFSGSGDQLALSSIHLVETAANLQDGSRDPCLPETTSRQTPSTAIPSRETGADPQDG